MNTNNDEISYEKTAFLKKEKLPLSVHLTILELQHTLPL